MPLRRVQSLRKLAPVTHADSVQDFVFLAALRVQETLYELGHVHAVHRIRAGGTTRRGGGRHWEARLDDEVPAQPPSMRVCDGCQDGRWALRNDVGLLRRQKTVR